MELIRTTISIGGKTGYIDELIDRPEDMNHVNVADLSKVLIKAPKDAKTADPIHPDYYKSESGMELADVIEDFGLNFNIGNVWKYTYRDKENRLEDLRKARYYLDREIKRLEAKNA